ncbi:hypothetical protein [Streptomyces sp. NPDC088789]|uniref:hypothetical protein n=1 Tax=Streptomyces sp. NPDC088789 TaxID=3365899 RepID=UPI00382EE2DB
MNTPSNPRNPSNPGTTFRDPDGDRRWLRLVFAVPFTLLTLIAAFFCWAALVTAPDGPWDDEAYAAIALSCALALAAAVAVVGLWLLPSVRKVIGWRWLTPALALAAVAAVRWGTGT